MSDAATAAAAPAAAAPAAPNAEAIKLEKIKAADAAMKAYFMAVASGGAAADVDLKRSEAKEALKVIDIRVHGVLFASGSEYALNYLITKAVKVKKADPAYNAEQIEEAYSKYGTIAISMVDQPNSKKYVTLLQESRAAKPAEPAPEPAPAPEAKQEAKQEAKPAAGTPAGVTNKQDENTLTIERDGSLSGAVLQNKALMKIANDTFPNLSSQMQAYLMSIIIAQENGISTPDQVKPGVYKIPDERTITENADKVRSVQYKSGATVEELLRKDTKANPATTPEAAPPTPPEAAPTTAPAVVTPPSTEKPAQVTDTQQPAANEPTPEQQAKQIAADTAVVNAVLNKKRKILPGEAEAIESFLGKDSSKGDGKLDKKEKAVARGIININSNEGMAGSEYAEKLHTLADALRKAGVGDGREASSDADKASKTTATGPRVNQGRGG